MADENEKATKAEHTGPSDAEVESVVKRLLADKAGGDHAALANKLTRQNMKIKADLEAVQAKLDALTEAHKGVVKERDAAAERLKAYEGLGEPDALKSIAERFPDLEAAVKRSAREREIDQLAERRGYDRDAARELIRDGYTFQVVTEKGFRGKDEEFVKVVDTGPDGKERTRPIEDVEKTDWKIILPALRTVSVATTGERGAQPGRPLGGSPYRGSDARRESPAEGRPASRELDPERENQRLASGVALGI